MSSISLYEIYLKYVLPSFSKSYRSLVSLVTFLIENDASLYNEHKVQTNRDIYRLFVFDYKFLCATESYPYDAYVGLDDDSTMFAKSCSFHKRAAREEESKKAEKGKKSNFFYFHQSDYLKPTRLWVIYGWLHLTAETKVILQEIFFFSKKVLFHKFDQSQFISVQWNLYKADTIGAKKVSTL